MRSNKLVEIEEVNYAKAALTEAMVKTIVAAAGSVGAVLNVRHATAKEKGWGESPPSVGEFAKAVVAEPNLLKRPIVIANGKAIVGFNKTAYAALE